jgi:hypothetical protein
MRSSSPSVSSIRTAGSPRIRSAGPRSSSARATRANGHENDRRRESNSSRSRVISSEPVDVSPWNTQMTGNVVFTGGA